MQAKHTRTLWIAFQVPADEAGHVLADLAERVKGIEFGVVEHIPHDKNLPQLLAPPKGGKPPAKAKKSSMAGRKLRPSGKRSTDIARAMLADGKPVAKSSVEEAFKRAGYSKKSAQALLDKMVRDGRAVRTAPGIYQAKKEAA